MKFFKKVIVSLVVLFTYSTSVSAHVSVKPNTVNVGAFQTFTVSVPNEKDNPTVEVRVLIPEGLNHVTPNVKPGWQIEIVRKGDMKGKVLNSGRELTEEEIQQIAEIRWHGGSIPTAFREEFNFSAQVPAEEKTVNWIAYQRYENGEVVAWDQDPDKETEHSDDSHAGGPYSKTEVVNDLANSNIENSTAETNSRLPQIISIAALFIAGISLWMQLTRKK